MKLKLITSGLLCIAALSSLCACSSNDTANINFSAQYNAEDKQINTVLTNDTGDEVVLYNKIYKLYKKDGNEWTNITFEHADFGTSKQLFPEKDINSTEISFSAYNTAGENLDLSKENENGGLESGDYKITVDVEVYDNSDFSVLSESEDTTFPTNNPEGKVLKSDAKGETKTLTAEFTV